jgi:Na+/H+-translocating membrane pyrophosphatase
MVLRVKNWYKVLMLLAIILSTPVVLYLFSLQLSNLILFALLAAYAGLVFFLIESFILKLEVSKDKISTIYFSIPLSDIIDVEDGFFETRIRTRWKVYKLPPIEGVKAVVPNSSRNFEKYG